MSDGWRYPSRPLDTVERFWFVRGLEGGAICVGVALVEGPLDPDRAHAAARGLARRHPVLGVRIAGDGEPRFEPGAFEAVPLRVVAETEETWQRVAEVERHRGFDTAHGPLWRITVIIANEPAGPHGVVLAAHHSVLDGHSHMRLLEDFVRLCAEELDEAVVAPGAPLDSLIALTPRSAPFGGWRQERIFPIAGRAKPSTRRTRFLVRDLDAAFYARMRERVRRERTTLHALLCVGSVAAAFRLCGPIEGFQLMSPVSLRALCRPPLSAETIGCYSSGLLLTLDMADQDDFWGRVRGFHKSLLMAIGRQDWRHDPLDGPEALVEARRRVAAGAVNDERQGRLADLVVSSAGDVDDSATRGALRIVRYYEVAGQHSSGHCFALWPHGARDVLCLTLGYVTPVTAAEYAERYLRALKETLVEACA